MRLRLDVITDEDVSMSLVINSFEQMIHQYSYICGRS